MIETLEEILETRLRNCLKSKCFKKAYQKSISWQGGSYKK